MTYKIVDSDVIFFSMMIKFYGRDRENLLSQSYCVWQSLVKYLYVFSFHASMKLTTFMVFSCMNPGFNVETVEYKNISFTVWDVGGQDKV